uniref:NADH dehydrogenase subunit 2 n=1 Tax=Cassianeura cassiae TaxID=2932622 RepID=UPI001FF30C57|nr:NADH dehydrogenase subunit 2 [Cassianeura cassiae]UOH96514.1 NADH dehydrogenase subunit 2 [Cassianeura cassiae]
MKMNLSKMFFLGFMIIGVMLCLCSNNWLFIWCGLELSLISFLPLMHSKMILTSESSMKYFLVQSLSSSILILGLMMMLTIKLNYELLILMSLMIKMGVAPFHSWLLSLVEGLSNLPLILMFTLSKLPPLMIMSFLNFSLSMIISINLITGSLFGLNQSSLKKIIAYSSIFNIGLMLMSIKNNFVWLTYLIIYSFLLISLIILLDTMNTVYLNQMIMYEQFISNKINSWFILLSMGGLPPLLGFSIKLMVIEFCVNNNLIFNLILMIFSSLLVMFYYTRLMYLSIMFISMISKWKLMLNIKNSLFLMTLNLFLIPLILTLKVFN